jgi:hypothetical protein
MNVRPQSSRVERSDGSSEEGAQDAGQRISGSGRRHAGVPDALIDARPSG